MKNCRKGGIYAQHSTRYKSNFVRSILGLDNGDRGGWLGWNSSRLAVTVRVPLDTPDAGQIGAITRTRTNW